MSLQTKVTDQSRSAISAVSVASVTATLALDSLSRAIYIGGSGDLSVEFNDGVTAVFKGADGYQPLQVKAVNATGTTATDIVVLF